MPKAEKINLRGTFEGRDAAAESLLAAGDAALVIRGVPRMLLVHCPCRCGDTLVLNLDRRAGPAWRHYVRNNRLTVFPSYWRDSACESHFILWNNQVLWCDWDEDSPLWGPSQVSREAVLAGLNEEWVDYVDLAENLGEIPWDVLQVCRALEREGLLEMQWDRLGSRFRRKE